MENNAIREFIDLLTKWKDIDDEAKGHKGEVILLMIGIDNYKFEDNLDYCTRDSDYLTDIITSKAQFRIKRRNVYKVYNEEATKLNILSLFRKINRISNKNDELILHVAGHVNNFLDSKLFVPFDGERANVYSNISSEYINKFVSLSKFKSCIVILNTFEGRKSIGFSERRNEDLSEITTQLSGIDKSKLNLFNDLVRFLKYKEPGVKKSIFHYTNKKNIGISSKDNVAIPKESTGFANYLLSIRQEMNESLNEGRITHVLKLLDKITENNDHQVNGQAKTLLYYRNNLEANRRRHSSEPLSGKEFHELSGRLVQQVHDSGYYLVPRQNNSQIYPENTIDNKVILLASADTQDQCRLRLDEEFRAINLELMKAKKREEFDLVMCLSSRISDVQRKLLEHKPYILHFSGHGKAQGICLVADEAGTSKVVANKPLSNLFNLFSDTLKCVFLNSCYSSEQSNEIQKYIDSVVCMNNEVNDDTAIRFASSFYAALGNGEDIDFSFEFAKNSIELHDLDGVDIPELRKKNSH